MLAIIVSTFLSLADLNLPFPLHALYAFCAFSGTIIFFAEACELVGVEQKSQEIIDELLSVEQAHLQGLTWKGRVSAMKKAKAFKPVVIPIGSFCGASMDVARALWEEILNQILFLFSL